MTIRTFTRREGLGLVTATALVALPGFAMAQASSSKVVTTRSGRVRGLQAGGVSGFWGIPFGADTSRRRFQPAVAAPKWAGVRECIAPGAQAPQMELFAAPPPSVAASPGMAAVQALFNSAAGETIPESEDCLFLNVFTPNPAAGGKRPVLFWLHGGGFASGTGGTRSYDGAALCRRGDVVVVTINSRLNAMGYLYLGDLHADFADSGNVGQLDQVLALEWVRNNIEAFGGDPRNITIFGESGGGAKVSTLMGMPPAQGRFHKAIAQSGTAVRVVERASAAAFAEKVLAQLGIAKADVHKLQKLDYKAVIAAAAAVQAANPRLGRSLAPVLDGRSLPAHPFDPMASAVSRNVPMIVGTNKDESTLFSVMQPRFGSWTEDEARARFKQALGARADDGYALFRKLRPDYSPTHLVTALSTAQGPWLSSVVQSERKATQGGAPAYMYRLDWETPVLGGLFRSPHGLDVGFVFDHIGTPDTSAFIGDGPVQRRLAAQMSQSWINFARTGDPSIPGVPWPKYEPSERKTMIFDTQTRVVADPDRPAREFLA